MEGTQLDRSQRIAPQIPCGSRRDHYLALLNLLARPCLVRTRRPHRSPDPYSDHSREIDDIVRQWPHLRVLRSCALSQPVMDTLTSRQTLDTLSIELNNSGCTSVDSHHTSTPGRSAAKVPPSVYATSRLSKAVPQPFFYGSARTIQ